MNHSFLVGNLEILSVSTLTFVYSMIKFRYAENGNEIVNTEFSALAMYEENVWTFFPQQKLYIFTNVSCPICKGKFWSITNYHVSPPYQLQCGM